MKRKYFWTSSVRVLYWPRRPFGSNFQKALLEKHRRGPSAFFSAHFLFNEFEPTHAMMNVCRRKQRISYDGFMHWRLNPVPWQWWYKAQLRKGSISTAIYIHVAMWQQNNNRIWVSTINVNSVKVLRDRKPIIYQFLRHTLHILSWAQPIPEQIHHRCIFFTGTRVLRSTARKATAGLCARWSRFNSTVLKGLW